MSRWFCILSVLSLGLAGGCGSPSELTNPALNPVTVLQAPVQERVPLVDDGQPMAVIAVARGAEAEVPARAQSVRPAAEVIRRWVKAVSGAELPIVEIDPTVPLDNSQPVILVGWSDAVEKLDPPVARDDLPLEGFCTFTRDGVVVVAGNDDERAKGTLWGAYDFVERFAGVRFYYPGIGTVVPSRKDLSIPACAFTDAPTFPFRFEWDLAMDLRETGWPWDKKRFPDDHRMMFPRWRVASTIEAGNGAHTPMGWPRLYGKTRPELFWKDRYGVRHVGLESPARLTRFDVSNPAVVDQYIKDLRRHYQAGWTEPWKTDRGTLHGPPHGNVIRFGLMDNRLDIVDSPLYRPDVPRGEMTDVVFDCYRRMALAIKKEWPEKKLVAWAYSNYRMPPTAIERMPDNFHLQMCDLFEVGFFKDPTVRRWYVENVVGPWSEVVGGRMTIFAYLPLRVNYPLYYVHSMVPYCKYVVSLTRGVYYCNKENWARDHINHYIRFRLSWNPDFNVDAALEEYYRLAYGDAAPMIGTVYRRMIEAWDEHPIEFDPSSPTLRLDSRAVYGDLYPPAFVDEVARLLQEARRVTDPQSLPGMRVRFLADSFEPFFEESKEYRKPLASADVPMKMGDLVIDGNPDDPWWTRCKPIRLQDETEDTVAYPGTVRVCYDEKALYLVAELKDDKTTSLRTAAQGHDGSVWLDDSVELFLAPPDKSTCVQIIVNAEGTVYDQKVTFATKTRDKNWTARGLEAKVRVERDRWVLEMKLPFETCFDEPPKPGQLWFGNIVRNKMTEPKGTQAFSVTFGNNHDPDRWGRLRFEGIGF